nr:transporter substrate-binding domain-containing protein [Aeromonas sp. sif2416]
MCLCLPLLAQAQTLTVKVPSRPINDLDNEYQLKLLELALNHAGQPFKLERVELNLNQYSLQQELRKGKTINVFWMGTSSTLESALIPIPIPLFRGLEGLRIAFIHRDAQEKFNQVGSLADLKVMKAAQGVGWADNKILELAGIPTYAGRYSNLFRLINDGDKLDFFPRGLVEVYAESHELLAQYPNLAIEQHLLLRYPFAEFFFVSPESPKLAKAIQTGLERAYADGSFMQFFRENPKVREALTSANLDQRLTIPLVNPDMTPLLRSIPAQYWEYPPRQGQ